MIHGTRPLTWGIVVAFALTAGTALAQSSRSAVTLEGIVHDSTGAAVPGATVDAT